MTFITLMTILGILASAFAKEDLSLLVLVPFLFKVMVEFDNFSDYAWLLEEKVKLLEKKSDNVDFY